MENSIAAPVKESSQSPVRVRKIKRIPATIRVIKAKVDNKK